MCNATSTGSLPRFFPPLSSRIYMHLNTNKGFVGWSGAPLTQTIQLSCYPVCPDLRNTNHFHVVFPVYWIDYLFLQLIERATWGVLLHNTIVILKRASWKPAGKIPLFGKLFGETLFEQILLYLSVPALSTVIFQYWLFHWAGCCLKHPSSERKHRD